MAQNNPNPQFNSPVTGQNTQQPAGADQSQTRNKQRGTGFTNINRIVQANQGAGQKMGQKIGSTIQNQAQSVREGIETGRNQFQQGLQQSNQQAQQNFTPAQQLTRQSGETESAYATRVAQQQGQDFSQVGQNLRNTQYQGPQGLQNAEQLQSQSASAAALARLAGSQGGQGELARSIVAGRGRYTTGQGALDQLLLGREGQQDIRRGRSAATGLTQQAANTALSAEQQAQAAASGISQQKQDILKGLQQGVSDIDQYGVKQAEAYGKDVKDLQSILTGGYDASTPEAKARAEDLLNRMSEYGLQDTDVYMGNAQVDPKLYQNRINQLANTAALDFGARRLSDQEKLGGKNLAQVLADEGSLSNFENAKYIQDAFEGKEDEIFKDLNERKKYDTETRDVLQKNYDLTKQLEQKRDKDMILSAEKEALMGIINPGAVNKYGIAEQGRFGSQRTQAYQNTLQKVDTEVQKRLNDLMKTQQAGFSGISDNERNKIKQQVVNEMMGNIEKEYEADADLNRAYSGTETGLSYDSGNRLARQIGDMNVNNGFLAFADRGNNQNDLGERFRGLGLGNTSALSGALRESSAYKTALDKALGQTKSLKQIALDRILGSNK